MRFLAVAFFALLAASPALAQNTITYEAGTTGLTNNVIPKAGTTAGQLLTSPMTENGTYFLPGEGIDVQANPIAVEIANAGTTGTTASRLAKLTGAPSTAVVAATTDTGGIIGIVISGAGTTGNAVVAVGGQASCLFDGATTAGHYVSISATQGGECHDAGASRPSSGQILGFVLSTNGAGGTYAMQLIGPAGFAGGTGGASTYSQAMSGAVQMTSFGGLN